MAKNSLPFVPKLNLDSDNLFEDKNACGINPQKIHILNNKIQELCSEAVLSQEIDKMQSTMNAKKDFNERDDIVFYMTSEDLFKVQTSKSPVYIRLRPEQPSSKITIPYIESIKSSSESPVTEKRPSPRSHSPKITHLTDAISSSSSPHILTSPTLNVRKSNRRSNSANGASSIDNGLNDKHLKRMSQPVDYVIRDKCLNFETKSLTLNGVPYSIWYRISDVVYSIFIIEQQGSDIQCKGLEDSEVNGFEIEKYKSISVDYPPKAMSANVHTLNIIDVKFPVYFIITTFNYSCCVKEFVGMAEDLINLAKIKYIEKSLIK